MLSNSFDQALFSNMIIDVFFEIRLIDKTQGSEPTEQEYYWMRTLKTFYPYGLNFESDY